MLVVNEITMHELTLPDRSTGRVDTTHDTLADESVGFRRKGADNLTTVVLLFIPFPILFHAYIFVDREATGARLEGILKKKKQKLTKKPTTGGGEDAITTQDKITGSRKRREFGNKRPLRSLDVSQDYYCLELDLHAVVINVVFAFGAGIILSEKQSVRSRCILFNRSATLCFQERRIASRHHTVLF